MHDYGGSSSDAGLAAAAGAAAAGAAAADVVALEHSAHPEHALSFHAQRSAHVLSVPSLRLCVAHHVLQPDAAPFFFLSSSAIAVSTSSLLHCSHEEHLPSFHAQRCAHVELVPSAFLCFAQKFSQPSGPLSAGAAAVISVFTLSLLHWLHEEHVFSFHAQRSAHVELVPSFFLWNAHQFSQPGVLGEDTAAISSLTSALLHWLHEEHVPSFHAQRSAHVELVPSSRLWFAQKALQPGASVPVAVDVLFAFAQQCL